MSQFNGETLEVAGAAPLRRVRASDAPAVLDAFRSDAQMSRQGTVRTLEEADTYVKRLVEADGRHEAWAITEQASAGRCDSLIGLVAISVDTANLSGWFWYWMHADHRSRGMTSRAATAVANWALSPTGAALERLELGHRLNNPASGAVARAAGFILEGRERGKFLIDGERIDVLTYGRLRTDPWPNQ